MVVQGASPGDECGKLKDENSTCSCSYTPARVPDEGLVEKAKAGDTHAYGELVRRYWRVAFALAFSELSNPELAEEAAQEGLLKGFRKLHQLRDAARFASWILRIVDRHAKRMRKFEQSGPARFADLSVVVDGKGPGTLQSLPSLGTSDPEPYRRLLNQEEKNKVFEAVRRLKQRDRVLLLLRYFEGLSFKSISKKTGRSEGALRVQLHRTLDRMKQELRDYFEGK